MTAAVGPILIPVIQTGPKFLRLHGHFIGRGHQIPNAPEFLHVCERAERDADIFVHGGNAWADHNIIRLEMLGERRYLACKQRIRSAVNDRIGIEPNP